MQYSRILKTADHLFFHACRLIIGLWYFIAGLNFFLGFFPQPMGKNVLGQNLMHALIASHLFHVVKAIEMACAVFLIANRGTAAAILTLFPILVVVSYFNLALESDPTLIFIGWLNTVTTLVVLWKFRAYYRACLVWRPVMAPLLGAPTPG